MMTILRSFLTQYLDKLRHADTLRIIQTINEDGFELYTVTNNGTEVLNVQKDDNGFKVMSKNTNVWSVTQEKSWLLKCMSVVKKYDFQRGGYTAYSILLAWTPFGFIVGVYKSAKVCGGYLYISKESRQHSFMVQSRDQETRSQIRKLDTEIEIMFEGLNREDDDDDELIDTKMLVISVALVISEIFWTEQNSTCGWTQGKKTLTILFVCILLLLIIVVCFSSWSWL